MLYRHPLPLILMAICFIKLTACNGGSGNDSNAEESENQNAENALTGDSKQEKEEASGEELREEWVYNERFDFKVKVPSNWEPQKKSDNKDGIFVKTNNPEVDIRVFGQVLNDVSREMEAEACQTTESFRFKDDVTGKKCIGKDLVKYYRDQGNERITVYIKAPHEWIKANQEKLAGMAKSLSKGGMVG